MAECMSGGVMGTSIPGGGCDTRAADRAAAGITGPTYQKGSQYWMNSGFTGPEPSIEVKQALSSADYARDWIGQYSQNLVASGLPVSKEVQTIAHTYPVDQKSVRLWEQYPSIAPPNTAQGNPYNADVGINPQGQANLAKLTDALENTGFIAKTPDTDMVPAAGGGGAGTGDTSGGLGSLFSGISTVVLLGIGVLLIVVFYLFSRSGRGHGHAA